MNVEYDIAIVGMSCRFPGARNTAEFWRNLAEGLESISRLSDQEMIEAGVPAAWLARPDYVKASPVLDDPALFDAAFFGYTPMEARNMDPQHRILLELAHAALEDAGCNPETYRGRIGVFAGAAMNTYFMNSGLNAMFAENYIPTLIVNDKDFLATRISYKLGLRGPSLTVQTACSTSLVAVHLARQSLLNEETDLALAGAVSVRVPHRAGYFSDAGGVVSPDGHVRAFDANANGTVFGSGAGAVVLKRLADAISEGDNIYAVIKGSAVNNDGAGKAGYTAPSVDGQSEAVVEALANAGITADSISYVEAHGSGTPVGDPIEVLALTKAFRNSTQKRGYCAVGSVKTNVGHLDAAAGMAGLIKTVLALRHGKLPPSLHFSQPNPEIDFGASPFYVNTRLADWSSDGPRRAGIMATGMGGTNAYVVLESAPEPSPIKPSGLPHLLILSAKTATALDRATDSLREFLERNDTLNMDEVAYTLQAGRRGFPHRRFLVCSGREDALATLREQNSKRVVTSRVDESARRPLVFLLPGVGDHYLGMGHELYEQSEVFRQEVDRCSRILEPLLGADIREIIYPKSRDWKRSGQSKGIDLRKMLGKEAGETESAEAQRLNQTRYVQPALFTIEYALTQLWKDLGIAPDAIIGHSMGEYVAACLAGVLSLEDALRLVTRRSQLVDELPRGAMLAVPLAESAIVPLLRPGVSISLVNGPNLCVVAGPAETMAEFERALVEKDINCRPVKNAHAFHSRMLDPIVEPFEAEVRKVRLAEPRIPFVSNLSGDWISNAEASDPAYWARHANHTARFSDALNTLWKFKNAILLEVGPGRTLGALAMQHPDRKNGGEPVTTSSLRPHYENVSDIGLMLNSVGRLWLSGVKVRWPRLRPKDKPRLISLPTYPFERTHHWIDNSAPETQNTGAGIGSPASNACEALIGNAACTPVVSTCSADQPSPAMAPPVPVPHGARADRREWIAARLRTLIKELSGIEVTDDTASFTEMGFESLFLTQASQLFQSKFGVKVSFRQMLDELSSISLLAAYLDERAPSEAKFQSPPAPTPQTQVPEALPAPVQIRGGSALEQLLAQQIQLMQLVLKQQRGGEPQAVRPAVTQAADGFRVVKQPVRISAIAGTDASAQASKRFGPYKPLEKGEKAGLTSRQQKALDHLIARYVARTAGSKRYTAEHRPHFADPRAVSGFRANWKEMVYPIVAERSKGSRIWDIDGNEYVDVTMGFGIYLFGHSPDWLMQALQKQLQQGIEIGPQSKLAGKVARLICDFTGLDRVTFCNTGSEAVMAAIRLARMITGRRRVVFFTGDYHGMFEEVLVRGAWENGIYRAQPAAPGIPANLVENMLLLEYGAPESLEVIKAHGDEIAAVLVEPVRSRQPSLQPRDFMHALRSITEQAGSALIFDEMVTGFRCHPGGAQAYFGVQADMATYGKVLGGGIPIGILAGKRKFMDGLDGGMWNYGDDSFPEVGVTFFAGTFVRHPLAMTAAWSMLNHLKEECPKLQLNLAERAGRCCRTLNEYFERIEVPIRLPHFGGFAMIEHPTDLQFISLLWYYLRDKGIHAWENRTCYFTLAHSDEDYDRIISAFKESVAEMQEGGFLPESPSGTTRLGGHSESKPEYPRCDTAPLTDSQREILLAALMDDSANCVYNQSCTIQFSGPLNVPALEQAVQQLFDRHPALSSTFSPDLETQIFHPERTAHLGVEDHSGLAEAERLKRFHAFVTGEVTTPFDLHRGPLVRLTLFRHSAHEHRLVLTAHHLICDGWSSTLLIFDLTRVYNAVVNGRIPMLPPPASFADFARDHVRRKSTAEYTEAERFWLGEFADPPQELNLPTDRPRPAARTYSGGMETRQLSPELFARLKKATSNLGGTLFATLFSVCATLLHRLTSQDDLVIGVPAAGQAVYGNGDLVGHCMNFLPIRVRVTPQLPFRQFANQTKKTILKAYEHQTYTYGTLIQKLRLPRDPGRTPLVSAIFNIDKSGFDVFGFEGVDYRVTTNAKRHVNFDLFFNLLQNETRLEIECEYNTDLFERETIAHWLACFESLIEAAVENADADLDSLPLIPKDEEQKIVVDWNNTKAPFPRDETVHHLFEEQAARTPEAIAVQFEDKQLTYRELDRRANQLANRLRALGIGPNALVGLFVDRSLDMVVGVLGVLKAGGAYVPMDPAYPAERLGFMIKDSGLSVLIAKKSLAGLPAHEAKTIYLDVESEKLDNESTSNPMVPMTARDLAYTIYTSGSTGRPKGVQVEHRALVNFLNSMRKQPGICAKDVVLAVTTLSFDIAGLEIHLPLVTGAKIILAPWEVTVDGKALAQEIERHPVTIMQATPATWRLMLAADWNGAPRLKILCGGEALLPALAAQLLPRCAELWNMYGPTETTVWSTCCRISNPEDIHIGRPIDNTEVYILDENRRPLPVGVAGELLLGGEGLARGYLRHPELNAEKYVQHPFKQNQRLYRTGDLARWRADGNIDCLGRLDHQVKIRGFRIELEEIQAALVEHPSVADAVVTVRSDVAGEKQLVAYIVARNGERGQGMEGGKNLKPNRDQTATGVVLSEDSFQAELRRFLQQRLPTYMVPTAFVSLPSLPVTPNGKINRTALPEPQPDNALEDSEEVKPKGELELQLTAIWQKVLRVHRISVNDSFFELGGHSLLAAQLFVQIEKRLGVRLPLATLFQSPTIRQLAEKITRNNWKSLWNSLVPIRTQGTRPALFLIHGAEGNVLLYNRLNQMLPKEQPLYGLQSRGLDGREPLETTIAGMATKYIKEIKSVQPEGPYYLGGYCLGGTIALEIAQQMRQAGDRVALLAMIETYNLHAEPPVSGILNTIHKAQNVYFQARNLLLSLAAGTPRFFTEKCRIELGRLRVKWDVLRSKISHWLHPGRDPGYQHLRIQVVNDQAQAVYRPAPYDGKIVLFRPKADYLRFKDWHYGWSDIARQGVAVIIMSNYPRGSLNDPFVQELASQLEFQIEKFLSLPAEVTSQEEPIGKSLERPMPSDANATAWPAGMRASL